MINTLRDIVAAGQMQAGKSPIQAARPETSDPFRDATSRGVDLIGEAASGIKDIVTKDKPGEKGPPLTQPERAPWISK